MIRSKYGRASQRCKGNGQEQAQVPLCGRNVVRFDFHVFHVVSILLKIRMAFIGARSAVALELDSVSMLSRCRFSPKPTKRFHSSHLSESGKGIWFLKRALNSWLAWMLFG